MVILAVVDKDDRTQPPVICKNGEPATSGSGFTNVLPFLSKTLYDNSPPFCATNPSCAKPDNPPENNSPKRSSPLMANSSG